MRLFVNPNVKGPLGHPTVTKSYRESPQLHCSALTMVRKRLARSPRTSCGLLPTVPTNYMRRNLSEFEQGRKWLSYLDQGKSRYRKYGHRSLVYPGLSPCPTGRGLAGHASYVARFCHSALSLLFSQSGARPAETTLTSGSYWAIRGGQQKFCYAIFFFQAPRIAPINTNPASG